MRITATCETTKNEALRPLQLLTGSFLQQDNGDAGSCAFSDHYVTGD